MSCVQVCLCTSTVPGLGYGICAAQRIPQGTWIGPFQGVPLFLDKLQSGAVRNTRHLWEVRGVWRVLDCRVMYFIRVDIRLSFYINKPFFPSRVSKAVIHKNRLYYIILLLSSQCARTAISQRPAWAALKTNLDIFYLNWFIYFVEAFTLNMWPHASDIYSLKIIL